MPNTFKQVIPTANKKKTTKSFSFDHVTSAPFMSPAVIACREVVPNQTIDLALESFVRLNPLVKPTFGRARVNNRCFFVPMRVLMPRFHEFLESEPIFSLYDSSYGLQTSTPIIRNNELIDVLFDTNFSVASTSEDPYDLSINVNGTPSYISLTFLGKFFLKLCYSLGYKIVFDTLDSHSYSALPLLAYFKVIYDWYYPSQYINNSLLSHLLPLLQIDSLNSTYLRSEDIISIVYASVFCAYNDDLLVDAWDRPVAPNYGCESVYSLPDLTFSGSMLDAGVVQNVKVSNDNTLSTPIGQGEDDDRNFIGGTFTQYQHDLLKALTDYTKRHQLAGVRAIDRYLAEYGINLSSEIMKRSILLGSDSYNIQFGDVMSHSDTFDGSDGAILGDYAGKGIGYGNHVFNYNLGNEFGYLIVINTVIPDTCLYQGVNRFCHHKSIMDFYHADFDGIGVQAVPADEVYCPSSFDSNFPFSDLHDKVFGFVPRYAEYKSSPSILSGDFSLRSSSADLNSFHLFRDLSKEFSYANGIEHSVNFVLGTYSTYFNRIFYNQGDPKNFIIPENFLFVHHFEVKQTDETSPLYDTYDFKEVEKAVEVHTQAAKVN